MNNFIKVLFFLSVKGTFLTIILFLLKPLYKNRLSKKWQYYIWLVVIACLLFPFTVPTGFNTVKHIYSKGYSFIKSVEPVINQALNPENNIQIAETVKINIRQNTEKENINNLYITDVQSGKDNINENRSLIKTNNNTNKNTSINNKNAGTSFLYKVKKSIWNLLLSAKQNIFYIWLAVAIALFTRKITAYQSFTRYLKAGQNETSSLKLWEEMGRIIEKAGIKTHINLYTNNLVSSPLLTGIFHPCIIIPSEELDITDFRNIISHELVHFKRKDLFYKWLIQLTACIHWFNPFVYLIIHETGRLCELSCDEAVIKNLDTKGKKEYGNTLLNMANTEKTFKSSIASVTLNESKKLLKERLDNIMEFKKKTTVCTILSVIFTFALCITAVQAAGTDLPEPANNIINIKKSNTDDILNTNNNNKTNKAKKITYGTDANSIYANSICAIDKAIEKGRVILKNGIYYILAGGVPEKDMSTGGVTDGCIGITLEQTDGGYISIAPLEIDKDLDGLVEYVEDICNNEIKNKTMTKKEAELLTGFAVKLVEEHGKIKGIKDNSTINKEYKKWKIKRKNGNYYYKNKRVRIFADMKPDKSFLKFSYDKKGTVDIKITRDKRDHIKNIKYLSKEESDELLDGYF